METEIPSKPSIDAIGAQHPVAPRDCLFEECSSDLEVDVAEPQPDSEHYDTLRHCRVARCHHCEQVIMETAYEWVHWDTRSSTCDTRESASLHLGDASHD